MMKAVIVHEYGGPEVLKFEDVPRPEPKENEVLVRVIGAGVNPADPLIVSGKYAKEFGTHLPLIPGYDIAGVVEKTGGKVTRLEGWRPGLSPMFCGAAAGRNTPSRRKERRRQSRLRSVSLAQRLCPSRL